MDKPDGGAMTSQDYWEDIRAQKLRMSLPSRWVVGTRDTQRLLSAHIRPGMSVLEIGCAPGKMLAWVAKVLKAQVSGLDYSKNGMALANTLFRALELEGDLRCEDLFATTFPPASFDVVYSLGVIEHFEDPRRVVRQHVEMLKPGGVAVMAVPNFVGLYGWVQRHFDPQSLDLHNLGIMSCAALERLAPAGLAGEVSARPLGRAQTNLITFEKRWPHWLARLTFLLGNGLGWLQPFAFKPLCPYLVLKVVRSGGPERLS